MKFSQVKKLANPHKAYGEDPYSRLLRFVGLPFVWLSVLLKVPADALTWAQIPAIMLSAYFYSIGSYNFAIVGLLFLVLFDFLDKIDGAVARCAGKFSFPMWYLDLFLDHFFSAPLIYLGISLGVFFSTQNILFLYLGIAVIIGYFLFESAVSTSYKLYVLARKLPAKHPALRKKSNFQFVKDFVRYMYMPPASTMFIALSTLANRLEWYLLFFGITFPLLAIFNAFYEGKIAVKNLR